MQGRERDGEREGERLVIMSNPSSCILAGAFREEDHAFKHCPDPCFQCQALPGNRNQPTIKMPEACIHLNSQCLDCASSTTDIMGTKSRQIRTSLLSP